MLLEYKWSSQAWTLELLSDMDSHATDERNGNVSSICKDDVHTVYG